MSNLKYGKYRDLYRQARLEGRTPKEFGQEHNLSRTALAALTEWWKKAYPIEYRTNFRNSGKHSKYAKYREPYRLCRLRGESPSAFGKKHNLDKKALTALYNWWSNLDESDKKKTQSMYSHLWKPYREARLRGVTPTEFAKEHQLSIPTVKALYIWWKKNYPEEASRLRLRNNHKKYHDSYREARLKGETAHSYRKRMGLSENQVKSLYAWWKKNYPEEIPGRPKKAKAIHLEFREAMLNGETTHGFRLRKKLERKEVGSLWGWWKHNYPEEYRLISKEVNSRKEYHQLYREARCAGVRPVDFMREHGLERNAERALASWWRNNYPDEYAEHVRAREPIVPDNRTWAKFRPVPKEIDELREKEQQTVQPTVRPEAKVAPSIPETPETTVAVDPIPKTETITQAPPSAPQEEAKRVTKKGFFQKVGSLLKNLLN